MYIIFICEMLYITWLFLYEYFLYAYLGSAFNLFNVLVLFNEI
jgi:hypothetical protein